MRARNLKPGFFKNEELADGGPYAQLLFEGLWCMADRAGRLEDRPRRIKAEVFPYYELKPGVESLLNFLAERNFILRYQVEKLKLIQISQFLKHQSPHNTEKPSILPQPLITCDPPLNNESLTVDSRKLNGGNPPDSLIHGFTDSPKDDSLIDGLKDIATPGPSDLGIAVPSFFFSCQFFDIDFDYRMKLAKEYPALTDDLLKAEFSKMEDWIVDNKHTKKFKANGHLANPRSFIGRWLKKAIVDGQALFGGGTNKPKGYEGLKTWAQGRVKTDG